MRLPKMAAITALAMTTFLPVKGHSTGYVEFGQSNLFNDGSRMHFITDELNVIAPGQLIFFVNVEEKRPAFIKHMWKNPSPEMDFLLADKYTKVPKNLRPMAHVNLSSVQDFNICSINITKGNMAVFADERSYDKTQSMIATLMHEAVHCGHHPYVTESHPVFMELSRRYKAANPGVRQEVDELTAKMRTVFMEVFVGAYFRANSLAPGQSQLLDEMSGWAWNKESRESAARRYSNSFQAITDVCHQAYVCPRNLKRLHEKLISTPEVLMAVVRDTHAILSVGEGF